MKKILSILFSILSLSSELGATDAALLRNPNKPFVPVMSENFALRHMYRGFMNKVEGRPQCKDWIKIISKIAHSKDLLQKFWPETSLGGQVWSISSSRPPYIARLKAVSVYFTLKKDFSFYIPSSPRDQKAWTKWLASSTGRINHFTKRQQERLTKENSPPLPNHSGFYEDFKLVGAVDHFFVDKNATEIPLTFCFNIVNFSGVECVKIETGSRGDLIFHPK